MNERGCIFNIQSYSVHDGPGIRTVIFFKGCPLRCAWCSNPESQNVFPEPGYNGSKCLQCHHCVVSCPSGALSVAEDGSVLRNAEKCDPVRCSVDGHFPCVQACPGKAMFTYGRFISVAEVLAEVEKEGTVYMRSGGGITLSGGEALMQSEFAVSLLELAQRHGIHTAVETSACVPEAVMRAACARLDQLIVDIKLFDDERHAAWTGVHNGRILSNIAMARREFPELPVRVRTPLIPGVNDSEADIAAIANFIREWKGIEYEILPYHALGAQKYAYLGREYSLNGLVADHDRVARLQDMAAEIIGSPVRPE